jgi:uncharacterized protein
MTGRRGDAEPVTVVIRRRVLPGREADYEAWVHDISATARRFPGHQGISALRPEGTDEYVLVMRFAGHEELRRWETSEERHGHLRDLEALTADQGAWEEQTGLETWFTLPGRPAPARPPARWRMAVLTTVGLYPLLVLTQVLVGDLLEPVPMLLRPAITTPVLVVIMTWGVSPLLTRAAYRWLYPARGAL